MSISHDLVVGVCAGWMGGACAMWAHFKLSRLIRSREEWMRATGRSK